MSPTASVEASADHSRVTQKEQNGTAQTTLALYWDLASLDPATRLVAAQTLISTLTTFQAQHVDTIDYSALVKSHRSGSVSYDALCAPDVAYAVKRLIRGLPSARDGARQGFSLALTQLLSQLEFLSASTVLELLEQHTQVERHMKQREERDMYYGKLFGFLAIIKSGLLQRDTSKLSDITAIISKVLLIASKFVYLRQVCYHILVMIAKESTLIQHLPANEIHGLLINKAFPSHIEIPEELWLAVILQAQNASLDFSPVIANNKAWKSPLLLSTENKSALAEVLSTTTVNHPQVHSVWFALIDVLLADASNNLGIAGLWQHTVEEILFDTQPEKKYLAFQLFQHLLVKLQHSSSDLAILFSRKFIKNLVINLSNQKTALYKASKQTLDAIITLAKENKNVVLQLTKILNFCSAATMEKLKKQNILGSVLSCLDEAGVSQYIQDLKNSFLSCDYKTESNEPVSYNRQKMVLENLTFIFKNTNLPRTEAHLEEILLFLVDVALMKNVASKTSPAIRSFAQDKLIAVFSDLIKQKNKEQKSWSKLALDYIHNNTESLLLDEDEEVAQMRAIGASLLKKLTKKISKATDTHILSQFKTFQNLVEFTLIETYLDASILPILEDLEACFTKMFEVKKRKTDELNPVDVLVDILLNFLSKSNALLRSVAESTFAAFCDGLGSQGLQLILDVLNQSIDQADVEDDEDVEDDMEESSDESEVSSDEDSDEEVNADDMDVDETPAAEEDEEEPLDDEAMAEYDAKLAEIFKQQKQAKKSKKQLKEEAIHFKIRVIDLIGIFLSRHSSSVLCMEMVTPLVAFLNTKSGQTDLKPVCDKALNVIKRYFKPEQACTLTIKGDELKQTLTSWVEMLREMIASLLKGTSAKPVAEKLSELISYVTQCILLNADKAPAPTGDELSIKDQVIAEYKRCLENSFERKKTPFTADLFVILAKLNPAAGLPLIEMMADRSTVKGTSKLFKWNVVMECIISALKTMEDKSSVVSIIQKVFANMDEVFAETNAEKPSEYAIPKAKVKESMNMYAVLLRAAKKHLGHSAKENELQDEYALMEKHMSQFGIKGLSF